MFKNTENSKIKGLIIVLIYDILLTKKLSILTITYFCFMNSLKRIIDFYIFSNIHVALAGFCITKITLVKFGVLGNLTSLFVGLSIVISYNFIRLYEIKTNRLNWLKKWFFVHKKSLLILTFFSIIGLIYLMFFTGFNQKSIYILFPFVFMTFFYVIPLLKVGKIEFSFRNFPFIKIFSIAIAWAGITVFFPLLEAKYALTTDAYIEFFERIFFIIAITIPFDIRDVNTDPKSLKTLPQVFGIKMTKLIGLGLLFLFVVFEVFKKEISFIEVVISILISIITAVFLLFSNDQKSRYYTSFWVEAIPIIWFILVVLFL